MRIKFLKLVKLCMFIVASAFIIGTLVYVLYIYPPTAYSNIDWSALSVVYYQNWIAFKSSPIGQYLKDLSNWSWIWWMLPFWSLFFLLINKKKGD